MNEKISLKRILKKGVLFFLAFLYITLVIALAFGSLTASIFTLIPASAFGWTVSKANYLGYYSVCSFAPFSTIILVGMSIMGSILFAKLGKFLKKKYQNSKIASKFKMLTENV